MTASMLRPQLQATVLRKLNATSSHKKNLLQKGFTLVELMIVIVIVGILSAVALPNFLNQTSKAKGTECTAKLGAMLSQAGAEALGGDDAGVSSAMEGIAASNDSDFCTFTSNVYSGGIYTASVEGAGDLDGKYNANGCVNPDTGKKDIKISTTADAATTADCAAPAPAP
ncbi:type II secretion system protein [Synechococcus sp. CBW1107]|uniref:pilin n=1 Tax=Synechococcus sp. CBW1107 TaxID=2789857 RepID=UPI002AD3CA24|nr:type II secretion system protein [Synechococcus sp. CBW1107]CAK6700371.1 hypothetical protein MNNICLKF_02852 [Synechococcus sp. CBW1107]